MENAQPVPASRGREKGAISGALAAKRRSDATNWASSALIARIGLARPSGKLSTRSPTKARPRAPSTKQ
mgnify:CR=1 FL=1